jgi:hypothetical protein
MRLSGSSYWVERPRVGAIARMRAVNEVRLYIARRAPEASWISRRAVGRQLGWRGHVPNAVVEIGVERHAIIILLRTYNPQRVRGALETHMARYDAAIVLRTRSPATFLSASRRTIIGRSW